LELYHKRVIGLGIMSLLLLVTAGFVSHGQKAYAQNVKVRIDTTKEFYAMYVDANGVNPEKAGTVDVVVGNIEIVCDCLTPSN
jgi:hypothetical protein